jgi:hypothetical protein
MQVCRHWAMRLPVDPMGADDGQHRVARSHCRLRLAQTGREQLQSPLLVELHLETGGFSPGEKGHDKDRHERL